MQVICIVKPTTSTSGRANLPSPEVIDRDNVTGEFRQFGVATIDPDLDETTLVNEEWEQKYCEPVNYEPCV